jgi:hypothetical protein
VPDASRITASMDNNVIILVLFFISLFFILFSILHNQKHESKNLKHESEVSPS